MIDLITGLPGNGKTLYAIQSTKARAEKENRPVFYYGITDLALPWLPLEKPEDWVNCPDGSIIVIDEAQKLFRVRSVGSAVPAYVAGLETHRHRGLDIVLITQHPMLLDTNVRRLVGRHCHVVRAFGMERATIHEFGSVREQCDKASGRADSVRHEWSYPKDVYNLYRSAELHTVKRRVPARVFLLFIVPLLLAIAAYFLYQHFTKPTFMKTVEAKTSPGQPSPENFASGTIRPGVPRHPKQSVAEYVDQYRPRIDGLEYTAPIYDEITKPVDAPFPAACVQSSKDCKCYSQQATRLAVPLSLCRQIVASGYFDNYRRAEKPIAPVLRPSAASVPPDSLPAPPVQPAPVPALSGGDASFVPRVVAGSPWKLN